MYSIDFHTHTRFFHGWEGRPTVFDPLGARLLGSFAHQRGLDGVVVTNHDYYRSSELPRDSPVMIPGIEVSTTAGHVLIVGPDPPSRTTPGRLTPEEAVAVAHDRDCVAIIAHPYRHGTVRESTAVFDAVEINGKNPRTAKRVQDLAKDRDVPLVGGSDAHFPFEVGRVYTRVQADVLSPKTIVTAVRDGDVEPHVNSGFRSRLLQKGYRWLHRSRY